jgi:acetyltransferase-like isoleucine patch superfamily enzyme
MSGLNTFLLTGTHDYRKKGSERRPAITDAERDIIIQDGVWIGWNSTIVGPCEIGENAVIAAGSVVVNDCDAGAIYAGNHAEKVSTISFK